MGQSKASTEQDYVDLQIRVNEGDTFKVQGAGSPSNRKYGVSDIVTVNPAYGIGGWVKGLTTTASSLAGGTDKYVQVQAAIRGEVIHFQVNAPTPFCAADPNELSRDYGAIFNIPIGEAPALADFVHSNSTGGQVTTESVGTDDSPDESWSGPSTYKPDDETGKCLCGDCDSPKNGDGTPKTVVIDGVTYNITPIE